MSGFLSGALDENPDVEAEVDCGGGFFVTVNWLSPAQQDDISEGATSIKKRKIVTDRDGIAKKWCKAVVKGWRGLTQDVFYNRLRLYVKPAHQVAIDKVFADNKGEFPYSPQDAIYIYLNAQPDNFHVPIREKLSEMSEETRFEVASDDTKSAQPVRVSP